MGYLRQALAEMQGRFGRCEKGSLFAWWELIFRFPFRNQSHRFSLEYFTMIPYRGLPTWLKHHAQLSQWHRFFSSPGISTDAQQRCQLCRKTPNCWSCVEFRGGGTVVDVTACGVAQHSCACIVKLQLLLHLEVAVRTTSSD